MTTASKFLFNSLMWL